METGVPTPETPTSAAGAASGKAKLRRALRTAIDVAAIAPSIAAALEGNSAQPDVREAFRRIDAFLSPLRSKLAAIDADDDVCAATLAELSRRPGFADELAAMERLWELAGIASRLVHVERLTETHEAGEPPAHLSEEEKAANKRLVVLEAFAGRTKLAGRPWRHLIDVSSVCNLRCKTCYQANSQDFIYYDYAAAKNDAVREAMPFAQYVNIGGTGEPLLSPTAPELVRGYAATGAHVELTTNGTLPERLAAVAPYASSINISMDGATKATFDVIRFGANFDKIVGAIRALPPDARAKININCVVTRPNAAEGDKFVALAQELGVRSVTFQEFFAYLPWHGDMKLRPQDRRAFFASLDTARPDGVRLSVHIARSSDDADAAGAAPAEALAELKRVPPPKPKRMKWEELAAALAETAPAALAFIGEAAARARGNAAAAPAAADAHALVAEIAARIAAGKAAAPSCMAPFNLLYLQGDGEMRPCCVLRTQVGSLRGGSFEAAWNDPAFVDFRATIQGQRTVHPACVGCRDGNRWGDLVEALEILSAEGIDVARIARPADFEPPESIAGHELVKRLGTST